MRIPRISAALAAALSIPLLAGGAFAVASSVSTQPRPQIVIPARTSSVTTDHSSRSGPGKDDKPGLNAKDDHGKDSKSVTTPAKSSDDPAGHDATDDHGNDAVTGTTTPDDHAVTGTTTPDDHGTDSTTSTSTPDDHGKDSTTGTTTPDDHGGNSGHGS
jgi:hypothetical protein